MFKQVYRDGAYDSVAWNGKTVLKGKYNEAFIKAKHNQQSMYGEDQQARIAYAQWYAHLKGQQ